MRVAMDAVIEKRQALRRHDLLHRRYSRPDRAKYDLKYYVSMAKELEAAGAHVLGLKDMAGLLKPASAEGLVKALKEEVGLPIHFHTHDTAGIAWRTILPPLDAGVDAVDAAMDALLGQHSQPTLGSVVEALRHTDRDTRLEHRRARDLDYWEASPRPICGL